MIENFEKNVVRQLAVIFIGFFLIQMILGGAILYIVSLKQTNQYLQSIALRIKDDITYQNKKWDIYRYNADPKLPDTYPLYVLSADGYVIDRWKPLHGFLDVSDFGHSVGYTTPTTIITPTNQSWRMYSKVIQHGKDQLGIITIAKYNPDPQQLENVDKQLLDTATQLYSKIAIKGNDIDVSNVDSRDIRYDVSFQVINNYNKILAKNNNTNSIDQLPNYIDSSYIGNVLNSSPSQIVKDSITGENFLLISAPIIDNTHTVVGVIVVGKSIQSLYQIIFNYVTAEVITAVFLSILLGLVSNTLLKRYLNKLPQAGNIPHIKDSISSIHFDRKPSVIVIDEEEVVIPYATNQFYMCDALFSHPKKRWEVDELLEKFGETTEENTHNWRKVYDSMLIINKKISQITNIKLIVLRDKTYFINPDLASKIK